MKDEVEPEILRLAAFSDGDAGGNPAGVVVGRALPSESEMQRIATEVGYSETVFAAPEGDGWRVRYFSPEDEVAFCGHATVALGSVLAEREGAGAFPLEINAGRITVEARREDGAMRATLTSPPTRSTAADPGLVAAALELFALTRACSRYQLAFAAEVSTRGPNSEARRVAAERIDADVDPLCFPEDRPATRTDVALVEAATVRMTILAARGSDAEALDP